MAELCMKACLMIIEPFILQVRVVFALASDREAGVLVNNCTIELELGLASKAFLA